MNHTKRFFTCIAATVLMLTLCSCSITGRGVEGIVYDAETHVLLPDSEILVQWYADFSSPVDSAGHRCIHQTSTRTDANGRFSVAAWARAPRDNERGFLSGIVDKTIHPAITIYHPRYKVVYQTGDKRRNELNDFFVVRSRATPEERLHELKVPIWCSERGEDSDNVTTAMTFAMLQEGKDIASADSSLQTKYEELRSYLLSAIRGATPSR